MNIQQYHYFTFCVIVQSKNNQVYFPKRGFFFYLETRPRLESLLRMTAKSASLDNSLFSRKKTNK